MESTVLRLIPKHEKRVIRILNLKIIYQIMIFSFDELRKCNDYKRERDKSNFDKIIGRGWGKATPYTGKFCSFKRFK